MESIHIDYQQKSEYLGVNLLLCAECDKDVRNQLGRWSTLYLLLHIHITSSYKHSLINGTTNSLFCRCPHYKSVLGIPRADKTFKTFKGTIVMIELLENQPHNPNYRCLTIFEMTNDDRIALMTQLTSDDLMGYKS